MSDTLLVAQIKSPYKSCSYGTDPQITRDILHLISEAVKSITYSVTIVVVLELGFP